MPPGPGHPPPDAQVKGDVDLTWEKVDGIDGYVLELQCLETASDADAKSDARFTTVRLPAGTTSYAFNTGKMPKGRWRWRVHTLSGKSVAGEMGMWRAFRSL